MPGRARLQWRPRADEVSRRCQRRVLGGRDGGAVSKVSEYIPTCSWTAASWNEGGVECFLHGNHSMPALDGLYNDYIVMKAYNAY